MLAVKKASSPLGIQDPAIFHAVGENWSMPSRGKVVSLSPNVARTINTNTFEAALELKTVQGGEVLYYRDLDFLRAGRVPYQDLHRLEFFRGKVFDDEIFAPLQIKPGGRTWYTKVTACDPDVSPSSLSIFSGSCMFGVGGAVVFNNQAERFSLTDPRLNLKGEINTLRISSQLSLYEVENLSRISALLNELNDAQRSIRPQAINILIPGDQYLTYLLPKASFSTSIELLQKWIAAVDDRQTLLQGLYRDSLSTDSVNLVRPMKVVGEVIRSAVESGSFPLIEDAISAWSKENPLVGQILANKTEITWSDLVKLSYSTGLLTAATQAQSIDGTTPLLLQVDSPHEETVLKKALEIMTEQSLNLRTSLAGLYPHEEVFLDDPLLTQDCGAPSSAKANEYHGLFSLPLYVEAKNVSELKKLYGITSR